MPVYNGESFLGDAIKSVLDQDYLDWRLYIVDDLSTDQTEIIARRFSRNDNRITYIKNEMNLGVSEARNVGIRHCNGKYISFLDSDDLWEKNKLSEQKAAFDIGYNLVCGNYNTFSTDIEPVQTSRQFPETFNFKDMLSSNKIGNLTGAYNAKLLGKFYQKPIGHEDYLMWLDIIKKAGKAYCVQKTIAYYRVSGSSLSSNKIKAALWQWNIYRYELKISFFTSVKYFLMYFLNSITR